MRRRVEEQVVVRVDDAEHADRPRTGDADDVGLGHASLLGDPGCRPAARPRVHRGATAIVPAPGCGPSFPIGAGPPRDPTVPWTRRRPPPIVPCIEWRTIGGAKGGDGVRRSRPATRDPTPDRAARAVRRALVAADRRRPPRLRARRPGRGRRGDDVVPQPLRRARAFLYQDPYPTACTVGRRDVHAQHRSRIAGPAARASSGSRPGSSATTTPPTSATWSRS